MTIPLPKYFNANKSLYSYKISCANFLLQHTCQMFCSLAKAIAVTAVIVLGSCEFCQVRIMNMQNKSEIWPTFLSSLSMFSICQLRLKEKKKKKKKANKKKKFSLHFERQMGFIRSSLGSCIPLFQASHVTLFCSITVFVQRP